MKKFLSLVLALVMTMSLVTVSAGAKDFTDAEDITYVEAVEVMTALKIVDGDTAGNFNPTNGLTRGAAAKIICNLILGPTTAAELNADTNPYPDVDKDSVFAGYIAYCQKEGIISGYANGTFQPAAPLTGYAFMKMLLGALGYDPAVEGYTGANWSINVAKQAIGIGLNDGLVEDFNGSDYVTREEAMLYAFNALQSTMVQYEAKTAVSIGDAEVVIAGSDAQEVAQGAYKNTMDAPYLQFAEKYFGKLTVSYGYDAFERPATTWRYAGDKVGTYTATPDLTYSENVKLGTIYADLGMTEKDSIVPVYVNGVEAAPVAVAKQNTNKIAVVGGHNDGLVGNGSTVEVFYDADTNDVMICVIDTYVGTVQKWVEATANKDAYLVIDEAAVMTGYTWNDTFETDVEIADDTVVLYTYSGKELAIQSVVEAESVKGTLTKKVEATSLSLDDTTYKYAFTYTFETGLTEAGMNPKSEYTVYFDEYGYAIYVVEEQFVSSDYALVTAIEAASTGFTTNRVKLLTAEGVEIVKSTDKNYISKGIDAADIVTYKVNEDGTVAMKEVVGAIEWLSDTGAVVNWNTSSTSNGASNFALSKNEAKVVYGDGASDFVYANSKTVFVVRDANGDYTVYTGITNVPTITPESGKKVGSAVYCRAGNLATVMFIDACNASIVNSSKDAIFVATKSASKLTTDIDDNQYFTFNAVVKGENTTITVEANANTVTAGLFTYSAGVYSVDKTDNELFAGATYDADGIITNFTAISGAVSEVADAGTVKLSGEYTVGTGAVTSSDPTIRWTVATDAKIWTIDGDGVISAADLDDIKTAAANVLYATKEDGELTNVFVQLPADTNAVAPGIVLPTTIVDSVVVRFVGANLWVECFDADGTLINSGSYDYELLMRGPSQDDFNIAATGTIDGNHQMVSNPPVGSSWQIVVDGVASNVVTRF